MIQPSATPDLIRWQFCSFDQLSVHDLYALMKERQRVFAVEQNCVYLDADGADQESWHLLGWAPGPDGTEALAAYLRLVQPGVHYTEPSIGRVITAPEFRGRGYGKVLVAEGIRQCTALYPGAGIRISAQLYLERFYSELGFHTVSEPYIEDNIPHIRMLRG